MYGADMVVPVNLFTRRFEEVGQAILEPTILDKRTGNCALGEKERLTGRNRGRSRRKQMRESERERDKGETGILRG